MQNFWFLEQNESVSRKYFPLFFELLVLNWNESSKIKTHKNLVFGKHLVVFKKDFYSKFYGFRKI